MKKLFLVGALILGGFAMQSFATETHDHDHNAESAYYSCTYDNLYLVYTGTTKTEWGKLYGLYRCANNHNFWIAI